MDAAIQRYDGVGRRDDVRITLTGDVDDKTSDRAMRQVNRALNQGQVRTVVVDTRSLCFDEENFEHRYFVVKVLHAVMMSVGDFELVDSEPRKSSVLKLLALAK